MTLFSGRTLIVSTSNLLSSFMYNLRSRLQRVNYRTLHGLSDNDMSARKHTEHSESERDTEESQVPSDQDHEGHEEIPDETAEELEALIAKQESTLDNARQKVKLVALKQKVKRVGKGNLGRTAQARACHGYKQDRE